MANSVCSDEKNWWQRDILPYIVFLLLLQVFQFNRNYSLPRRDNGVV